jgi:hypothetical protein
MNSIGHNAKKLTTTVCLLAICSSLLVACGGGGESSDTIAGIGGTGIVSGKITGFGSIHVNGGKFEIDNSLFDVDGDTFVGQAGQDALSVGMVVRLRVETENGVFGNTALEVVYDDEIEGPVAAVSPQVGTTKTITVFGKIITIDETGTLFENTTFLDIEVDDVVEVSGFRVSPTQFNATYVEETAEDVVYGYTEVELRGIIDGYFGGSTFEINGTLIHFDPMGMNTEIEVPGGIGNGLYVEVEGFIETPASVFAEEIELEDEDFDDDVDEISLEGIVTGFAVGGITNFFVDSQQVNASRAQFSPTDLTLVDGLEVEVEGPIIGGILMADEVEEE